MCERRSDESIDRTGIGAVEVVVGDEAVTAVAPPLTLTPARP